MTGAAPAGYPLARPAEPKGWLATFAVVVVMVGIIAGGFTAALALSSVPDKPVAISHGVTIVVPADWEFNGRADPNTILLSRGGASVAITVNDGSDAAAAARKLHDEWSAEGTVSVGDVEPVTDVRGGRAGTVRFAYSGTLPAEGLASPVEGEVTAVTGTSVNVVFDAWASTGQFVTVRGDILAIIDRTKIP